MRLIYPVGAWFEDCAGGGYRVAYDLARGFCGRGYDCHVVCPDVAGRGAGSELCDGVRVHRYQPSPHRSPDVRNLLQHVRGAQGIVSKLAEDETETIVHGVTHLQMLGAMRARPRRTPQVMTIASPLVEEMQINLAAQRGVRAAAKRLLAMQLFRRIESHVLRRSDAIHVMSEFCAGLLTRWYGQDWQRKSFRAAGWADARFQPLEQAAARTQLDWPRQDRIVVCIRRLERRMGIDHAIEAIDLLKQRGQRVLLYIAGRGSLREQLQQQVDERGLRDQVVFLGYVPDETLPALYSAADVSLVPTRALECFGLTVVESHACGTPCIVTPVGSLPELFRDQFPQWVASDSTGPAIADCLSRFFAPAAEVSRDQLAEITGRRYDRELILDRFEAEYRRLTTNRRETAGWVAESVVP